MQNTIALVCRHGEMTGVDTYKKIHRFFFFGQIWWKHRLTKFENFFFNFLYHNYIFVNFCTSGYLPENSLVFMRNFLFFFAEKPILLVIVDTTAAPLLSIAARRIQCVQGSGRGVAVEAGREQISTEYEKDVVSRRFDHDGHDGVPVEAEAKGNARSIFAVIRPPFV